MSKKAKECSIISKDASKISSICETKLAEALPLVIKDFIPSEMYLTDNLKPRIEFTVESDIDINLLNCFANTGGNWSSQKITNVTKKRLQIVLNDRFKSGRGRINCTVQKEKDWHWFGYQFLIK